MSPAVGLPVLLGKVFSQGFQLFKANERNLSSTVDQNGAWFDREASELTNLFFAREVGRELVERVSVVHHAESSVRASPKRSRPDTTSC